MICDALYCLFHAQLHSHYHSIYSLFFDDLAMSAPNNYDGKARPLCRNVSIAHYKNDPGTI